MIKTNNLYFVLKKLFNFVSRRRKIQFLYLIILTIISSLAEMMSLGSVFFFIKIITQPENFFSENIYSHILSILGISTHQELIVISCFIFAGLIFIAGCIRVFSIYFNLRLATAVSSDLYLMVYTKILHQPYTYYVSHNSNEILSIIANKVVNITNVFANCILIFTSSIILFSILLVLFIIDTWNTAYALLFFSFVYFFIIRLTRIKLKKNSQLIATQQNLVIKVIQEGLGGIRDIILDKTHGFFIKIYRVAVFKVQKAISQNTFISQSPRFILESISLIFISVIIMILAKQKINNIFEILPILGSLAFGAQRILPLTNQIYQAHSNNKSIVYSLIDVIAILEQKIEIRFNEQNKKFFFNKSIILKDLNFSYNKKSRYIIQNLNYEILKGCKVAIIGPSGCGKSTLLDLIMGLLEPTSGEILVDNFSIKENKDQWQKKIAHVPQFIYLSDATILENIAFGVEKSQIDRAKALSAAKQAQIHDFIQNRELGYDEIVGERGIKLSGGQRQRIGIARALYKNAELLILDEATSALDDKTEEDLLKVIDHLDKHITVLIVAHRQSSLKNCTHFLRLGS
jgi:ABC-type multidrug transport system fused ATPase/permease subunit